MEVEHFARPAIHQVGDGIEIILAVLIEFGALGQALADEAVGTLAGATLTEAELAGEFNDIGTRRAQPALARFIAWVAKRPPDYHDSSLWSRERRREQAH